MDGSENKMISFLLSGEKKKITLILAKLAKQELLIMKEPEANLDPSSTLLYIKIIWTRFTKYDSFYIYTFNKWSKRVCKLCYFYKKT
ncbi:hypothetical protein [Mycoplasma sp. Mirounga ES2805-ORL]|uniref:hypothetical protein n=1 Tax=Mycoplasma sp. Mirounga ES2805-ORL TaxID=754514 RepID=UPI00197BD947|nr:hypothetical protein [Mycoplasma sp. Mirounga ES2805-ORL]QSF13916.1 hypothetical protein JXZ90_01280 [Mycoplasma sp. Mirounga ES2805-ORL]